MFYLLNPSFQKSNKKYKHPQKVNEKVYKYPQQRYKKNVSSKYDKVFNLALNGIKIYNKKDK